MQVHPELDFDESDDGAGVQVRLTGELDLATVPQFEARLRALRASRRMVHLDLSQLDFIDLAGARALARALSEPSADGWLEIEPALSNAVRRLLDLVDLDSLTPAA